MGERWGLSKRNATLEVGLSEGTCSLLRRAHPNERAVGAVKTERGAGSRFVREQMLSPAEGAPE